MAASNFIDQVKICLRSGAGGAGSMHFRREKFVPKGGPDGGDGGRGGHIILKGNSQLWTLLHLKYRKHVLAENGKPGEGANKSGAQGKDVILEAPLGTLVRHADTGEVLAEITEDGEEAIIAYGGRGGLGNSHFKSATNQTPMYAQPGEPGVEHWVVIELKLLADVGLVGFPNAGKSTLLNLLGDTELTEAARAFGEGEFAKAYKLAEALYDDPPSDEVEAEAEYIMGRIDDRISTLSVRAETAEVEKNYALAMAVWTDLLRYQGLDDAEEAADRLKALKEDKEVLNELAKRRELLKLMASLDVQFQTVNDEDTVETLKFRKACLKAYRTFARDNEGTYAADEAEALIDIFEALVGSEEAKSPESMPDEKPKKAEPAEKK